MNVNIYAFAVSLCLIGMNSSASTCTSNITTKTPPAEIISVLKCLEMQQEKKGRRESKAPLARKEKMVIQDRKVRRGTPENLDLQVGWFGMAPPTSTAMVQVITGTLLSPLRAQKIIM